MKWSYPLECIWLVINFVDCLPLRKELQQHHINDRFWRSGLTLKSDSPRADSLVSRFWRSGPGRVPRLREDVSKLQSDMRPRQTHSTSTPETCVPRSVIVTTLFSGPISLSRIKGWVMRAHRKGHVARLWRRYRCCRHQEVEALTRLMRTPSSPNQAPSIDTRQRESSHEDDAEDEQYDTGERTDCFRSSC